ncbi:hypothetical protein [Kineosporia succinea]|uniref:Uncharacterized protein n=1 Tax=Kineosporia succinea TaxID=84632 RepID=A0ABT9NY47_9ACTN|nr:hypothetical protein [Kineosporia succinea]MDP9825352.1 hypothetical protein [Kineosporia succinea]
MHLVTGVSGLAGRAFGIVVFLEEALQQHEPAQACALGMPGVVEVSFSSFSRAIMYVVAETTRFEPTAYYRQAA